MIQKDWTYYGHHVPSNEDWVILGIDQLRGKVCAAGWPASIAELKDIVDLQPRSKRTLQEEVYVSKTFGVTFIN